MRSIAKYTLIFFLLFGSSCFPSNPSSNVAAQHQGGVRDSDTSFPQFWKIFRTALRKNDVSAILRMTRFPLEGGLETSADFTGVNTQQGFKRHFSMLFPDNAIRTMLTEIPDIDANHSDVQGNPMAWSISHITTYTLAEGDWTESAIIYRFERLDDGRIKLTYITIAG